VIGEIGEIGEKNDILSCFRVLDRDPAERSPVTPPQVFQAEGMSPGIR
jgi:hypothetical protein